MAVAILRQSSESCFERLKMVTASGADSTTLPTVKSGWRGRLNWSAAATIPAA